MKQRRKDRTSKEAERHRGREGEKEKEREREQKPYRCLKKQSHGMKKQFLRSQNTASIIMRRWMVAVLRKLMNIVFACIVSIVPPPIDWYSILARAPAHTHTGFQCATAHTHCIMINSSTTSLLAGETLCLSNPKNHIFSVVSRKISRANNVVCIHRTYTRLRQRANEKESVCS